MSTAWLRRCLLLLCLALHGCGGTTLYTDLSEREANTMAAALLRAGIAVERQAQDDGKVTLRVDEARLAEAVHILNEAGLPESRFDNLGQVFKNNGLVSSPMQERAQMIYALSQELAHSISEIDGIRSARVHVVLPDNDLLKRVISPSSASVLVRYGKGTDIGLLLPQIKTLVARGIAGLTYENVSVTAIEAVEPQPSKAPVIQQFLGLQLTASSLPWARTLASSVLLLVLGLAAALAWSLVRRRSRSAAPVVYSLEPRE